MKCTNCGNDVTNGALFCEYCGAKIVYQPQQQNIQQQSQPVAGQTGNNNKGLLIAIIAALSVMLVGVIIAAVVLLNKKPEERAEYTTEATTEETTEASTEATTEATTEEVVLVPYYEENNMIYSDCQETLHNGVYTFLVGSDDFFDRVESDQLEVAEHETDIKVTYATSTDAEEEGYEITKIYFNFDIPIEVTDHGYPDKYYYTNYLDLPEIVDYNTGIICTENALDLSTVDDGEITNYESVASEGDAEARDDAFFLENMNYTDIEYSGESYKVGVAIAETSHSNADVEKTENEDGSVKYEGVDSTQEVIIIYAPKDCRLSFSFRKDGITKEDYDIEYNKHNGTLATESDSEEETNNKEPIYVLGPRNGEKTYKPEDIINLDVYDILQTFGEQFDLNNYCGDQL